jgi:L-2-hydroxyglutarate oxidase LhgO
MSWCVPPTLRASVYTFTMEKVQTVVIGAGVVGLAIARALAMTGREVVVIESQNAIGTGTSSRNSEVVHAGIYYPQGSLKAALCVEGNQLLYSYAASKNVAIKTCGKLIVASGTAQLTALQALYKKAIANQVPGMAMLTRAQAKEMEPALECDAALWSPSSGIVDSHGLMLALQGDLEQHGGMVAFLSPLESAVVRENGIELYCGGHEDIALLASEVVNAAGLYAPQVAARIAGLDTSHVPRAYFAKGNYYSLAQKSPFSRLIYPIPEAAGLGVHLTLDLGGQARFGPDVEWLTVSNADDINYEVNPERANHFYAEIRRYWPGLQDGVLTPSYSGVRPKITASHLPAADFVIQSQLQHSVKGLVNLFGIESPGLTASLAIASRVQRLLDVTNTK